MSVADKDITNVGGCGGGGDDDDEDNEGGEGGVRIRTDGDYRKQKQRGGDGYGFGCRGNFRKVKKGLLFPFTKTKKHHHSGRNDNENRSSTLSASSSAATNPIRSSGKRVGGGKGGCYFCFTQPKTLDSPAGSQTSDPNDPNFTFEMLRTLIEKNDFYSKENNPHFDFDPSSCNNRNTG